MSISLVDLIVCFSICTFVGWVLETRFKFVRGQNFVNSGFLTGPLVSINCWGAITAMQILNHTGLYDPEYVSCINDIVTHPLVQTMKQFRHHKDTNCWEHSLNVSYTSYRVCKYLGWDYQAAARGGVLHDLFLYDWRTTVLNEGRHGFVHPQIALANASVVFPLNDLEKDIILKHMFPLTLCPPTFKESFLVCLVDKYCASKEVLGLSSGNFHYAEDLRDY